MRQDNIFVFGGEVEGESFLGRKKEIDKLTTAFRDRSGKRGHAIIGLNRVGKTSLIKKIINREFAGEEGIALVYFSLTDCDGKDLFWNKMANGLREEITRLGIVDEEIEKQFGHLGKYGVENNGVMTRLPPDCLRDILKVLGKRDIRVIIVLDEFDMASAVFRSTEGSFGLIRDMPSTSELRNVMLITLSRRELPAIEGVARGSTSTLDGVFTKHKLKAFSQEDIRDYWNALTDYDIFLDQIARDRLIWYTGRQPYMLSLYGNRMAEASIAEQIVNAEMLERICREERRGSNVRNYYKTMYQRMEEDGHVELLCGILYGPIVGIARGDVDILREGGYLGEDDDGYYVVSRDFTEYFYDQTRELCGKTWEQIMGAERVLKNMIRTVFPELEKKHYSDLEGTVGWSKDIQHIYPNVRLNESTILTFMRDALKYGRDASIAEVLTLTFQVELIKKHWNQFSRYFGDGNYEEWVRILDLLVRARKPLDHDNPEYLNETENGLVQIYCKKILQLSVPV
jgi:hypothetical protein